MARYLDSKVTQNILSIYSNIEKNVKALPKEKQEQVATFFVNDFMSTVDMFDTQAIRLYALSECDTDLMVMIELYEALKAVISVSQSQNAIQSGGGLNNVDRVVALGHKYEEVQRQRSINKIMSYGVAGAIAAIIALGASFSPEVAIPVIGSIQEKGLEYVDLVDRFGRTFSLAENPFTDFVAPASIIDASLEQKLFETQGSESILHTNPVYKNLRDKSAFYSTALDEIQGITTSLRTDYETAINSLRQNNIFKDMENEQARLVAELKPLADSLCHYNFLPVASCKEVIEKYKQVKTKLDALNKLITDVKQDEFILDIFKFTEASESIKSVPIALLTKNFEELVRKTASLQDQALDTYFDLANMKRLQEQLKSVLTKDIDTVSDITKKVVGILYYRGVIDIHKAIQTLAKKNMAQINVELTSFLQTNEKYNTYRYEQAHLFYKKELEQCSGAGNTNLFCKNLKDLKKTGKLDLDVIIDNLERFNMPLPVNFAELMRPIIKNPKQYPIENVYYLNRRKLVNAFKNNPSVKLVLMMALAGGLVTFNILYISGRLVTIPLQMIEIVAVPLETMVNILKIGRGKTEMALANLANKKMKQSLLFNAAKTAALPNASPTALANASQAALPNKNKSAAITNGTIGGTRRQKRRSNKTRRS